MRLKRGLLPGQVVAKTADDYFVVAQVLGEAGRYVRDQARIKQVRMFRDGLVASSIATAAAGFLLAESLHPERANLRPKVFICLSLLLFLVFTYRRFAGKIKVLETERLNLRSGLTGESTVAESLSRFPDHFHIIHDITTPFGNIDHVVVGPTGVFIIDTKNWRGIVQADGKGELLLNGKSTAKSSISQFTGRLMGLRDKVRSIAPHLDPYYDGVFVFTSARVEAKWGTTGRVNCLRDSQLYDYIVEKKFGKRLNHDEVAQIAEAFRSFAHSDPDFTERAA